MQTSWQRDLAQEVHIERSCTSGPTTGSWRRDPEREILDKRPAYRDPAQVVLLRRSWRRQLAQKILIHRSCTSAPTVFCWGDLKHLAQQILIQSSCTRGPTGSWCRHHDREIFDKRSADRDLGQEIRANRSCTSAPRILCASAPTASCWDPEREILDKRPAYRDLAEVALEAADAEILTKTSCRSGSAGFWRRDPDTDLASTIPNKKTPQHCLGSLAGKIRIFLEMYFYERKLCKDFINLGKILSSSYVSPCFTQSCF